MQDHESRRSRVNRREFVKGAAATGAAARLAMASRPGAGRAQRVRRLEVPAQGAGAQSRNPAACCKYGITIAAAALRLPSVRHHQQPGQPGLHVRQPDPARSARQRQDHHPRSRRIAGRSPRTARPTPSTCARTCSSTTAPSSPRKTSRRPSTASPSRRQGVSIPRSTLFASVERDRRARQVHRAVQARGAAAGRLHHERRSPAAGTASCARRRWRTTSYNLRRVVDIPGTGPFKSKRRVENEVWVMEKNAELLEQGPALSRRHRVLPRPAVLARAGLGDPVQPRSTMRASSIRSRARKAKATQGMSATDFYQSVIQAHLDEQQEEAARRSRGYAARIHLVLGQAGAGRRGQGRRRR